MRVVLHFSIEISKIVGKKIIDFILCTFCLCVRSLCASKHFQKYAFEISSCVSAYMHNDGIFDLISSRCMSKSIFMHCSRAVDNSVADNWLPLYIYWNSISFSVCANRFTNQLKEIIFHFCFYQTKNAFQQKQIFTHEKTWTVCPMAVLCDALIFQNTFIEKFLFLMDISLTVAAAQRWFLWKKET